MPVGEFEVYRRHRLILENWAKTRPHYQDLVAMILLEVGQRRLIFYQVYLPRSQGGRLRIYPFVSLLLSNTTPYLLLALTGKFA